MGDLARKLGPTPLSSATFLPARICGSLANHHANEEDSMSIAFEDRRAPEPTEIYSAESLTPPRNAFSPEVVDALLDLLSTDDRFRELFKRDPRGALRQVGHETPEHEAGIRGTDPVMCATMTVELASKEAIRTGRASIKATLVAPGMFTPFCLAAR